MKRWKMRLLGVGLAACGLVGCKEQLFEREGDRDYYRAQALKHGAPFNLDTNIGVTVEPGHFDMPKPPTVYEPERPQRFLSLQEAIATALEQGTTGFLSIGIANNGVGQANENVQSGRNGTFSDSIRVLALDPAIAGADIDASLSKFDARWIASQTWNKTDDAPINQLTNFQNGDSANLTTGIVKALPTGGVAGITFSMDYLLAQNNNGFFINPSYRPRLRFQFEQPLMQNYGVEINQLLVSHPGTQQIQRFRPAGGGRVEGILVTRVRFEQAKAELERNIDFMLLNVEAAYWNLYAAYGTLYARDRSIIDAYDLWRTTANRVRGGLQDPQDEPRTLAQLEAFRASRIAALADVIERERQLRLLMGLNDDGTRLVPIDQPTLAPFSPDWESAKAEALATRPELIQARQDLKVRQWDIMLQRNLMKPNLQFIASYDINGVGDRLDGSTNLNGNFNNALGVLALNKFNTWQFGFLLDVPIGYRDAHAALRVSRLNLLRTYASLRSNEAKVLQQVRAEYSRIPEQLETMKAQSAQFVAARSWYDILRSREDLQTKAGALEQLLSAQRTVADARAAEFRAIADYNIALAGFQAAKGSIMTYDGVVIGEGPLPAAAQVRATDHFRERTKAIVTRERDTHVEAPSGTFAVERDPVSDLMPANVEPPPTVIQMMNGAPKPGTQGAPALLPTGGFPSQAPSPDLLPAINNGRLPARPIGPTVDPMPAGPNLR
jgi:outer membrane protein TolC